MHDFAMAYCNGCGTSVPSAANFCQKCGSQVSDSGREIHKTDELNSKTHEQDSSSALGSNTAKINLPKNGESIECASCSRMYRADLLKACPKCGTLTLGYSSNKINNYKPSPRYEKQSQESNSGKSKWVIGLGLILIAAVFVLSSNSNDGVSTNENSENSENSQGGYWVSKCRNITELNPNYYDSDPSSITDNLSGPSRFITRRECTDVWVDN